MPKSIDLTGNKYGRLTVVAFGEHKRSTSGVSKRYWLCKCDCGNECVVYSKNLLNGNTRSCGCLNIDSLKSGHRRLSHGQTGTRLYKIWVDMKRRCDNPGRKHYERYGGRGITYCQEWKEFTPFYKWAMGNGYSEKLTLDRIDNDGNYEPNNCRWVSHKEQMNNTSRNHIVSFDGKTQTLAQWAEEYDLSYTLLHDRLLLGWSFEEALYTKPSTKYKQERLLTFNGVTMNITQWAKKLGLCQRTISDRLKMGLPIEQVLSAEHLTQGRTITYKGETHNITEWSEILGLKPQIIVDRLGKLGWSVEKALSTPYLGTKGDKS